MLKHSWLWILGLVLVLSLSPDGALAQNCPGACLTSAAPCPSGSTANYSIICPGANLVCCVASGSGAGTGGGPTGSTGTVTGGPTGSTGTVTGGPTGGTLQVTISNPLAFNTVNELLTRVLGFLQGFIVVLALIFIIIGAFLYITSGGDSGRVETAKKCITAALIGLALGIAAPAFLRQIGEILGWTATPPSGVGTSLTLLEIATNVLNFLLSVIGVVALIMLVIGAFMYLTAAGDEDRIDSGKKIVKYSIVGITVALAAMVLVRQIASFF